MQDSRFTIDRLVLDNYRKFGHFEIELDKALTVVIGDNGAGKTAFLDALAVAAGSLFAKLEDAVSPGITPGDARNVVTLQGSAAVPQGQYPVSVRAEGRLGSLPVSWEKSLGSRKGRTSQKGARELIAAGEDLQRKVSAGEGCTLPVVVRYSANRFAGNVSTSALVPKGAGSYVPSRTKGYAGAFDAVVNEGHTLTWLRNMTIWELQEGRESPELSCVKRAIAASLDGVADVAVQSVRFDMQRQDVMVSYLDPSGTAHMDAIGAMSEGYRSATLMFADIARRMAQLNPQLLGKATETPGIVMIDEVDLHLHPRWQEHIIRDLRRAFPNVQLVVTTHSPSVISSVRRENIRVMGAAFAEMPRAATYGRDVSSITEVVMGAAARPTDVAGMIRECEALLDSEDYDGAERKLAELESLVGGDDPGLVALKTDLALEQL